MTQADHEKFDDVLATFMDIHTGFMTCLHCLSSLCCWFLSKHIAAPDKQLHLEKVHRTRTATLDVLHVFFYICLLYISMIHFISYNIAIVSRHNCYSSYCVNLNNKWNSLFFTNACCTCKFTCHLHAVHKLQTPEYKSTPKL